MRRPVTRSLLAPTFIALAALVLLTCESVTDPATNDGSAAGIAPAGFVVTNAINNTTPPFGDFACVPDDTDNDTRPPTDDLLALKSLLEPIEEAIEQAKTDGDLDEKDAEDLMRRLDKIEEQSGNFFEKAQGKCDKDQDTQARKAFDKGVDVAVTELIKLARKVEKLLEQNRIAPDAANAILAEVDDAIFVLFL